LDTALAVSFPSIIHQDWMIMDELAQKLADKYSNGNPDRTMYVVFEASDGYNSIRSVTPNEVVEVINNWLIENNLRLVPRQ
jgi:hypothetical protein